MAIQIRLIVIFFLLCTDERDERGKARANVPTSVDSEDLDLADTSDQLYISMRAVKVFYKLYSMYWL